MKEYMEIGPTPYDESCAQVGSADYMNKASKELDAYLNQLNRIFSDAQSKGIMFKEKWFNHDFGSYGEICMYWNTDNEVADVYAYEIERSLPSNWDEEAKKELGI
jgi:hypothetical protein